MKPDIDWKSLGFKYMPTDCHVRHTWRNGSWNEGEVVAEPYLQLHIGATVLHYGQTAFEGLKAFRCRDDRIRLFRPQMNARRMARTARRLRMAEIPEELFMEAVIRMVRANQAYVPPYGTGGSLYIRPVLFGSGPRIGVAPSDEYTFIVFVLPVGPYYKGGLQPVRAVVLDGYDRTAPLGLGSVKVGGNYAASLEPHQLAADGGFAVELYLDAKEHKYVDEFATSNFVAITEDGAYVTPESNSILPSVTNDTLQQLARDMGHTVEVRPVPFDEIADFAEVAACGTAVVITPVNEIVRGDTVVRVGPREGCGPVLEQLYHRVRAIQDGDEADPRGWTVDVPV